MFAGALATINPLLPANEREDVKTDSNRRTWLLSRSGPNARIEFKAVARDKIDSNLSVDMVGLRLYVDSPRSLKWIREWAPRRSTIAGRLGNELMYKSGIEPDPIPVRGEAGGKNGMHEMVLIKGGEYERSGAYWRSESVAVYRHQGDKYRVRVSPFWIDKFKVTTADYVEFLNDGNPGYWTPWHVRIVKDEDGRFAVADPKFSNWPVVEINWYQATGYAKWAGKRLPTEAEWEFAAAGSEGRKYPWGNEEPDKMRANATFLARRGPLPAVALPAGATPDGVFGMAGNTAEWIADYYSEKYYATAPSGGVLDNPTGPTHGDPRHGYMRMFKGFCIAANRPEFFTCTKRHARPPLLTASSGIGFRCVKDVAQDRSHEAAKEQRSER